MKHLILKSLVIGIILTMFFNCSATIIINVNEDQFTQAIGNDSLVIEFPAGLKPGYPDPKPDDYSYLSYNNGFYFFTTTKGPRDFLNNQVISGNSTGDDVRFSIVSKGYY